MPQFDLHRNEGRNTRTYPFLLVVQGSHLNHLPTRLVMPLSPPRPRELLLKRFLLEVGPELYVMIPHDLSPAPLSILGRVVGQLTAQSNQITQAIDDVISTAYN